jgi:DnaK suppressor protein
MTAGPFMSDIAEIKKALESERDRLNTELKEVTVEVGPSDERREGSPFGKREEEADEAVELARKLAMEKTLTEAVTEVNRALEKIKLGTYGICDICGKNIEPARMEALPSASLCLNCKSKFMKDQKMRLAH